MLYVLSLRGVPVAAARRYERLNMAAADYSPEDQTYLTITQTTILH